MRLKKRGAFETEGLGNLLWMALGLVVVLLIIGAIYLYGKPLVSGLKSILF